MALLRLGAFLALLVSMFFLQTRLYLTMVAADCPLDMSGSNFTVAASLCSSKEDRGKCCRFINALIAVSISRYANVTNILGVTSDLSQTCLDSISQTFNLYGVTRNATASCGFGTKITVNYECQGRSTVNQMFQSPKFSNVTEKCKAPISGDNNTCRACLNAGILYLRNLLGPVDNMTLSICRDATFTAIASQVDYVSTIDIASCFFGVQGLSVTTGISPSLSPPIAAGPTQLSLSVPPKRNRHPYHLTIVSGIGVAVATFTIITLVILIILICWKRRELVDTDDTSPKTIHVPARKFQEGPSSMFRKFTYNEMNKATDNFSTVIGEGGFGIVYKAEFQDGFIAAVKRMSKVSEQAEDDFCREVELLAQLHHRHLVALRGFCIKRHERFLMYEFMANGSLKDHLQTPGSTPLSWDRRIQIAIDVANALEYLHFYCAPPLCHRDIKSSNILLDGNFRAKVADFGLAHASKDGSICSKPVNTDIQETPGYLDPEHVTTRELTEKSDIYSYGVILLELITGRQAMQGSKNLMEWSHIFLESESRITKIVDPYLNDAFDYDQLQTIVMIVKWCTQRQGSERPSIKQVLRLLYESSDPMHSDFVEAVEDEENGSRGREMGGKNMLSSGNGGCLASSSTNQGSRSFLLETGSAQSSDNLASI